MAKVLIVDDEEWLRETLREHLEDGGHEVEEAEDGAQAESTCARNLPDLMLTDLVMPNRDGIESIRQIKKLFPNLKIIAMSGRGGDAVNANLTRATLFGADEELRKPFTPDQLRETVKSVLAKK